MYTHFLIYSYISFVTHNIISADDAFTVSI